MALFQQAKQAATAAQNNYIAEIRCGRMNMKQDSGMVEPELEKGLLYVHRSREDMLVHLCWKNRKSDSVLDDLIVFEGDCSVKHIKQLPEHRVFFVKMNQNNERKFYWFQHTDKETDEALIGDLHEALNNTAAAEEKQKKAKAATSGAKAGGKTGNRGLDQLSSLLGGNADGNQVLTQLMQSGALGPDGMRQLLDLAREQGDERSGNESRTASAATSATNNPAVESTPVSSNTNQKGGASKKLKMGDLANAFSMVRNTQQYDMTKVLGTDSLVNMLGNKDVQDRLNEHMPKDEKIAGTPGDIRAAIGSPQYQQAVQAFQEALESGQLGPVLAQFQLPENAIKAAGTGNIKAFAEAMQGDKKPAGESSTSTAAADDKMSDDKAEDKKDEKTDAEKKEDNDASKEVDDEEDKMAVD